MTTKELELFDLEERRFQAQQDGNFDLEYELDLLIEDICKSKECDRCGREQCACGL